MSKEKLNNEVDTLYSLGKEIIEQEIIDFRYEKYLDILKNLNQFTDFFERYEQKKVFEIISTSNPEDQTLTTIEKFIYPLIAFRVSGKPYLIKNSEKHIKLRFVIYINRYLTALK